MHYEDKQPRARFKTAFKQEFCGLYAALDMGLPISEAKIMQ